MLGRGILTSFAPAVTVESAIEELGTPITQVVSVDLVARPTDRDWLRVVPAITDLGVVLSLLLESQEEKSRKRVDR
jgi:hypothetical protein